MGGTTERVIPVADIVAVQFRSASALVNGALSIQSSIGKTVLHVRHKENEGARRLYEALLLATDVSPDTKVRGPLANERRDAVSGRSTMAAESRSQAAQALERALGVPGVLVGPALKEKPFGVVVEQMHDGVAPWFVLNAMTAGQLVAFDDRLCVIKTGGMTAVMAGALGGGRITTIYYRDITGIEYNAQMLTGVLEIVTPSYQASANKDFWRGAGASRNADSNDPWTLSNTLPLSKAEHRAAGPQMAVLRQKIADSKNPMVVVQAPATGPTLANQLSELAALHAQGALTPEEFSAAKAALIARQGGDA